MDATRLRACPVVLVAPWPYGGTDGSRPRDQHIWRDRRHGYRPPPPQHRGRTSGRAPKPADSSGSLSDRASGEPCRPGCNAANQHPDGGFDPVGRSCDQGKPGADARACAAADRRGRPRPLGDRDDAATGRPILEIRSDAELVRVGAELSTLWSELPGGADRRQRQRLRRVVGDQRFLGLPVVV